MATPTHLTVVPAYGRDYSNAAAAQADFLENKDFVIVDRRGSCYVNLADCQQFGVREVTIRYSKRTKAVVMPVPEQP
jgi:hypothetical protein